MSKAIIALDKSKSFRVYLTITTDMVEQVRNIHQTTPLATAGLGRVLTAAGLMGIMMKNDHDKLTVQFKGEGPAKQILATAYGTGDVKGYIANPDVDLPLTKDGKLDVGGSLGLGDLTAYFFISEQQNSSVALGVKIERDYTVGAAGGMVIQMMPNAEEASIDALEEMLAKMPPMTTLIDQVKETSAGKTEAGMVRDLLELIFKDMPEEYQVQALEERDIQWNCDCSTDRMERALMSIGHSDLKEIIEEDGQAELQCQFCLKKYNFDKEQLEKILEAIS